MEELGSKLMGKMWQQFLNPKIWVIKLVIIFFIFGFLSLGFLDYLNPIKDFLDSHELSFYIGQTRFSVYLILKGFITVVMFFWLTGWFSNLAEKYIQSIRAIQSTHKSLIIKVLQFFVYALGFMIGLDILGIDLTALTVFSGALGIGIGVGLQKISSNFLSGLILLFEKSVENDDLIQLSDGTYGIIRNIRARYTLVETFDGKEMMIPNEEFITHRVTNWTFSHMRARVEISLGVSYESDIEKARQLMLEAAKQHPKCLENPEPVCFLREFADSSVNFLMFFWVADVTQGRFEPQSDVLREIWKKFKDHDISIPYPQRELHIKSSQDFQINQ